MGFANSGYVSAQGLENLKLYKYGAVDKSFVSNYLLRHYWEWAVTFFPIWMAPNLITLIGLGFILANVVIVLVFVPDLVGPGPSWMYYSLALGVWLYSTFDNVDGKQARRTKSSSPLGELFDHGCDALNCSLGTVVQAAGMGLGCSWYSVAILLLTTLPFYLTTWEEYHTGVLYLGYVNGPTEGLIIACLLMVASGVWGPHIYTVSLRSLLGARTPSLLPASTTLADVICAGMFGLLVTMHIPFSICAVRQACQKKGQSIWISLLELGPMISYILAGWAWLAAPGSVVLQRHLILFTLTVGIVFGRVATKIILAHLTKMPFPLFTVLLAPLYVGAALANAHMFTPTTEYLFLLSYFLFALVAYFHWACLVIERFCDFLKINCFTIPHISKIK